MKADGKDVSKKVDTVRKPETILDVIRNMEPQIKAALPKNITPERLTRIAITAVRQNRELANCHKLSLLGGIMQAAQLGLEPNTPLNQCFLIPYKQEATFVLGYKGLIDLCYRSGKYAVINAFEVYEEDDFDYRYGTEPYLHHKPARNPSQSPIAYYATYKTKDGVYDFRVWSRDKVIAHAKQYSKSWGKKSSPWDVNFDSMAKIPVLKDLLKTAQTSAEIQQGLAIDESVNRVNVDSDNLTFETTYEPVEPEPKVTIVDEPKEPVKKAKPKEPLRASVKADQLGMF